MPLNRSIVSLIFLALGTAACWAGEPLPWDRGPFKASPEALLTSAAKFEEPEDEDLHFLLEEVRVSFDAEGRQTVARRLVYRVLTDDGIDAASIVQAAWRPWHEQKPELRGRVVTRDGTLYELRPDTASEAPVEDRTQNLFYDSRILRAPLPGLEVGCVVEEETLVADSQPSFAAGISQTHSIHPLHRTELSRFVLSYPEQLPVKWASTGSDVKPTKTEANGRVTLTFEFAELEPDFDFDSYSYYAPPEQPLWPTIHYATGKSWREIATAYGEMVDRRVQSEAAAALARQVVGDEKDRTQKIARLLAAVQESVRYTGLEFGEAALVPYPPEETLSRRYGDCKDQSTLLVAMLRSVGIDANVALLSTSRRDMHAEMPGMGVFNHAIVYIPGEPAIWIDPTSRFHAVGQLPSEDQGKLALVATAQTEQLVRTPVSASAENRFVDRREVRVSNRALHYRITTTATGHHATEARYQYATTPLKDLRKEWAEYLESVYLAKPLRRFEHTNPKELDKPFVVVAEGEALTPIPSLEPELVIPVPVGLVFEDLPYYLQWKQDEEEDENDSDDEDQPNTPAAKAKAKTKKARGVVLDRLHVRELEFVVTPPAGHRVKDLPESQKWEFGTATLTVEAKAYDGGQVVVHAQFDTGNGRWSRAEVEKMQETLLELSESANVTTWELPLTFEDVPAAQLAAGQWKEAFAHYRGQVEADPLDPGARRDYCLALLHAGLVDAAREQAREAIQLQPNDAVNYTTLAVALSHDRAGRHFERGMDWQGALDAYQTALKLAPDQLDIRWNMAILLEHDSIGRRYGTGEHIDRAIREYEKLIRDGGTNPQVGVNLLGLLLRAEQFDKLQKAAEKMPNSLSRNGAIVAAVAQRKSVAAAAEKAKELAGGDGTTEAQYLALAGDILLAARQYKTGAAICRLDQIKHIGAVARKANGADQHRPIEADEIPPTDPRWPVFQMLRTAFAGETDLASLSRYFAKPIATEETNANWTGFRDLCRSIARMRKTSALSPARTGDVVSLFPIEADGSDEAGYRVKAGDKADAMNWYVEKTDDGYRIVGGGVLGEDWGIRALEYLTAGREAAARSLLEHARRHLPSENNWFEPLAGHPLVRSWTFLDLKKAEHLRLGAALLAANSNEPPPTVEETLNEGLKEPLNELVETQMLRALVPLHMRAERLDKAEVALDALVKKHDMRDELLAYKVGLLIGQDKRAGAQEFAETVRKRNPKFATDVTVGLLHQAGEFEKAHELWSERIAKKQVSSEMLNGYCWNMLHLGKVDQEALTQLADAMAAKPDAAALHTVATLQADLGEFEAAQESLHQLAQLRQSPEPDDVDWLVLALIAERCDLPSIAADYYQRVSADKREHQGTAYAYAQRRLKALGNVDAENGPGEVKPAP